MSKFKVKNEIEDLLKIVEEMIVLTRVIKK
jgi:hypothetical protein